ncbi:MAG TPA: PDZ domain-containing protein [Pirellulales bacterium]|nr:PDZ domain-containing protein [Pirellulales bacterium]
MRVRRNIVLSLWLCCLAIGIVVRAEEANSDSSQPAPSQPAATDIAQWIEALDSDRFALRQAATLHLQRAGERAVAPLAAAADGLRPEVTRRAIDVLAALSDADEVGIANAARKSLDKLTHSPHRLAANRAAIVLREQHLRQQRAALVELRNLGAEIVIGGVDEGELIVAKLVLGRAWQGGDEGLSLLPRVRRINDLKLYGSQFTDASLDAVVELSGPQMLRLYATAISDAGHQRLAAAFPGALIDRRNGALLGVRGFAFGNANGCRIDSVTPNSAAAVAGLQSDDVIVRLDDQVIADMNDLIAGIAKHRPGDRVRVAFLRDEEELTRDVVLGELEEQEP